MLKTALASLVLAACLAGGSALAQAPDRPLRTLTMTGTGEMRAKPDTAIVTLGVMSRADTARAALTANNAAMTAILSSLEAAGIAKKDIQTSNFSVNPVYDYDNTGAKPPRITGYDVSNQLAVTVRKLDTLGTILDEAVSKGSNQIYGITFTIDDPRALEDEARKSAVQDAVRKAKLYAESRRRGSRCHPIDLRADGPAAAARLHESAAHGGGGGCQRAGGRRRTGRLHRRVDHLDHSIAGFRHITIWRGRPIAACGTLQAC